MKSIGRFRWLLVAGIALAGIANAQDPDDQQRGVARISLMNGEVSVRRGDAAEWVAGVINAPLMTEDRIATAPNSRAEVQFDSSNLIRIGGNAEVRIAQLEYGRLQLEIAHGTVTYVVLRPNSSKVEVDTPSVSVRPDKRGVYRIAVMDGGETQVISRSGEVEVFTPRGSEWVNSGKMMVARGSQSDPEFQIVNAPPLDEWDSWNQSRDRQLTQSTSTQYVPEGVYGAEDLDQYGTWTNVPSYGYVWRPTVVVSDWAPYRHGRWVWQDWYGWTWVSYDPWGWAPYHYGRWFWDTGYGWCWYPGVIGRRHYWSPALVAWFGWGRGSVGFGFGNVGWVPLAPYETFYPWWGRGYYGRGFNRNINITNINITNNYRNARFGRGISGVGYEDFNRGRFNNIGRYSGDQIRQAGLIRGQMPIGPNRDSIRYSDRAASHVPQTRNATFYSPGQRTSQAARIPFEQQRQAFSGGAIAQTRGGGDNTRPPSAAPQTRGWRTFGSPGGGSGAPSDNGRSGFQNTRPPDAAPQNRGAGGWQRFGEPGSPSRQTTGREGRTFGGGNSPRTYEAPAAGSPGRDGRSFGGFGGGGSPRTYQPPSASPQGRDGRSFGGGSAPRTYEAPSASPQGRDGRSFGGGAPRTYEAPQAAPRGRDGRSFGGFGGSAPRSYESPSAAPRGRDGGGFSAPRGGFGGGGGGGFSAPRSNGGGGGFSAPRSAPRGGGGFSAPRGGGAGGGGGRPSGGGGGGRSRGR